MGSLIFLLIYFIVINIIGFFLMIIDKYKAKNHQWRIPESTLFTIAWIGGSIGSILGMYLVRHKTKKWKFKLGMPMILLLQIVIPILLFRLLSIKLMTF